MLRDFSLFSLRAEVVLEIRQGVFCLAGANGIGKSTVIAAINSGLTGRVPDRTQKFKSVDEYYRHTENYSARFFGGRIAEVHRDSAEVEIEFELEESVYRLTRGVFEPDALRELEINGVAQADSAVGLGAQTGTDLQQALERGITQGIGLDSFAQFVFLQLFLFTFDEGRHLAFWDDDILEQFLFLAFGFDPTAAQRADNLRRRIQKQDSIRRNMNWQATEARNKLRDLETVLANRPGVDEDLLGVHQRVEQETDNANQEAERVEAERRDAKLRLADASSTYATLQQEYEETFQTRTVRRTAARFHPLVVASLSAAQCSVCGSQGDEVSERLKRRAEGPDCPLCGTALSASDEEDPLLGALQSLDKRLSEAKAAVRSETQSISRLNGECLSARARLEEVEQRLEKFEAENEATLRTAVRQSDEEVEGVAESYRHQLKQFLGAKEVARERRDEAKLELSNLHKEVTGRYQDAETEFVPIFKNLAQAFLGLDVDVRFEARSAGISLALDVEGAARRALFQLSESQRFFVDIALRMALSQFMTRADSCATILIDTPEGSLDAAYESRAGEMFAQFVESGHNVIMTANINTSQLLKRLAHRCGSAHMQLCRMIEWVELSEVQVAEGSLFDEAYAAIEKALAAGPS